MTKIGLTFTKEIPVLRDADVDRCMSINYDIAKHIASKIDKNND